MNTSLNTSQPYQRLDRCLVFPLNIKVTCAGGKSKKYQKTDGPSEGRRRDCLALTKAVIPAPPSPPILLFLHFQAQCQCFYKLEII